MITLRQVPLLQDNYGWIVEDGDAAVVVDPGEAAPLCAVLETHGLALAGILVTHHHDDHAAGVADLMEATGCSLVVGSAHGDRRCPAITTPIVPGSSVDVGPFHLRVLNTAGHTLDHVAFAFDTHVEKVIRWGHDGEEEEAYRLAGRPALFVGDALFCAGCGRLFEGSYTELAHALQTLARQDPNSLICCGHEYTKKNLAFARAVLPEHNGIRSRTAALAVEMGAARSSVPSTLQEELRTNPFLLALEDPDPVHAVRALRTHRDTFVVE